MKILRFYIKLPPLSGGMEKHIYHLSLNQIQQGNDVTVFFNQGNKVSNNDIKILSRIKLYKLKPQFLAFFVFYLFSIIYLTKNKDKTDVIHIHGDWSSLLFINFLKKITNAKITCFSFHGQFLSNKITHAKFLTFLLKKTDLVFINGYDAYSKITKRLTKERVNVIWRPSGISSVFKPITKKDKKTKPIIITVANLIKSKNIDFILTLANISKKFSFYIVGDGPEKNRLFDNTKKENLSNVLLLGKKSEDELITLLNSSNLFLLPSLSEGTSTAIIEAMACGLPIICSNAGGVKELIKNGENGFVIDSFNEQDFLDKMFLILNSHELKEKIKRNNIEKSRSFYWDKVSKDISVLLENTLLEQLK